MSLANKSYIVQILTSFEEIAAIQQEWEQFLCKHAIAPGFWQDPKIIQLNIKYRDTGKPFIILLRQNNKIICILPGFIERTNFKLNFSIFSMPGPKIRLLKILGSCIIFSHDAIVEQCVAAILEALYNVKDHFDLIKLETLEENNPVYSFFHTTNEQLHFKLKITSPKKEHVWRHFLADTYENWLKTLGKSTRRLTRRRIKKLYKEFPDQVELIKITRKSEVKKFLDLLEKLYPRTWQARTFGFRKRNTQQDILFYQNIAVSGWLRSYMLLIKNEPAAFLIATQYANTFEAQEIGYDAEFASLGVGSTLNYMILQDLYLHDKPTVLSFGFGDNTYKKILCTDKTPAYEAYLVQTNFAGGMIKCQILVSRIEQSIRALLVKANLDFKIRNLLKRK